MNELTVTEVSRSLGVSTRMLRYYEKEGLIVSGHREEYAYRVYDEAAVRRLRQILLLRKLRLSLKEIRVILDAVDRFEVAAVFLDKIQMLNGEIHALSVIRDILVDLSHRSTGALLEDGALCRAVEKLSSPKSELKEMKTMSDLNEAAKTVDRARTVRIMLLPPMTVAAYHYVGCDPEEKVGDVMSRFVQEYDVYEKKPDARMFGFNHPNPGVMGNGLHGYEDWVTVPDDMEVPEPLQRKYFRGGMYAVMTIDFPEFHLWESLARWVRESDRYEADLADDGGEIMGGCLEEHLNWVYAAHLGWPEGGIDGQIDLMMPVKMK